MNREDQKIENLLNLALEATPQERQKSAVLEVGYDREERSWEVIVRHSGDLGRVQKEGWEIVQLSGGYAIVRLPQSEVELLSALPQVEYIEKPKRLYFELDAGRALSCFSAVQAAPGRPEGLQGEGVLLAVIDSGVDYFHPDFRNADGSTRIVAIWDQDAERKEEQPAGRVPEGFGMGLEYSREEINRALQSGSRAKGLQIVPVQDPGGHGTQVLGIAAGNGRSLGGKYQGAAPESPILVVKLGTPQADGFPRTTELMQALEYVIQKAQTLQMPVAVNLSFGNSYGSHRGDSLLETYLDRMSDIGRNVIVTGTGNEGNGGGHVQGRLEPGRTEKIEFLIGEFEAAMSLQIWKEYADEFEIFLYRPDGRRIGPLEKEAAAVRYDVENQTLLVYYGAPGPYQKEQEVFIDFLPKRTYLDSGLWRLELTPQRIVTGRYDIWMPDARSRGDGTRFLQPSAAATMTIPSTALRTLAVGAYDARSGAYASFSGRGWPVPQKETGPFRLQPDLVAPGVEVTTTAAGGGYVSVSGTSFAAPFVSGAAALLMEYGIINGNDPFLYGEKVKAYLQKGARPLAGFDHVPNNQTGYGALCVKDSFPV